MEMLDVIAYIIDDDADVRLALRWLIESVQIAVREFGSVAEFLKGFHPGSPGCIVLDVRMPGMSGMEFLDRMAAFGIDLPVILLSGHGTIPMATRAIRAGAVDFIQKPINENLLLDRIQEAVDKSRQALAKKEVSDRMAQLTSRETEVVRLIAVGRHNKEIAVALGLSPRTIEAHRAQAMKKLDVHTTAELVTFVMQGEGRSISTSHT